MTDPTRVTVIVVSYNTRDATLACLDSLARSSGPLLHVVVVDNASTDGSADAISRRHPAVELIRSTRNIGFGGASNLAHRCAVGELVLFLNSDCVVPPTTIERCVDRLRESETTVAVACQLRNPDGTIQASCRRFPTLLSEAVRIIVPYQVARHLPVLGNYHYGGWQHDTARAVDQPAAAFLLTRAGAWGAGQPFDERFFMFFEDVDLCRRIRARGEIQFTPDVFATHLGQHSTNRAPLAMAVELARSRHRYFDKWHGRVSAQTVVLLAGVGSAARAAWWSVLEVLCASDPEHRRSSAHRAAARESLRLLRGTAQPTR